MAKKKFKAESQRLLDLMINSIYTNREIFLREIISNASDAVDKLCFKALTDESVGMSRGDFEINVAVDKDARTITVSDNGIGMSAEEMEKNLGTIAKSGSLDFKNAISEENAADTDIIGQFGVGFYSAFMVSDNVTVISHAFGSEESNMWQSSGAEGYTITSCEKTGHGTDVIMHIKEDSQEENYSRFLDEYNIISLIKKYSDYVRFPIKMRRTKTRKTEGSEETETYEEIETLNSMIPIWQRSKSDVTEEEYATFYREKFFDFTPPARVIPVNVEGLFSYRALLFIPEKAAFDFYTKDFQKGLQLYSSGVMIMDKCADLLPDHFRFVRGVVDSPDLSLNISRELLQHDRQLKVMAKHIEKTIRSELLKVLENEREKYEEFFGQFGLQLKYGAVSDYGANGETLKDLLLFPSSDGEKKTTLKEYVSRMKEEQKDIYYATGESVQMIEMLPQAEAVREKGYEILYFTDEVDELIAQTLHEFDEKHFKSVNLDELELETEEEKEALKSKEEGYKLLLDFLKETLKDNVADVKVSQKLKSAPVCLSASGNLSFEMEKYIKAIQPDSQMSTGRILEVNVEHPLILRLDILKTEEPNTARKYAEVLYGQAELLAGLPISNPGEYSKTVFSLLE